MVVDSAVLELQQQLKTLFPGEDIQVTVNEEALTLSGAVSSNAIMLRAGEIAAASSGKQKVINLLQVPGGIDSQQVMLQVRFAEVNRQALTELGINFWSPTAWTGPAVSRPDSSRAPTVDGDTTTFSDFLNLFFFSKPKASGASSRRSRPKGYFQSLAEPNLIAYNGKEASFLAGGEFPVPFVSGRPVRCPCSSRSSASG